MAETVGLVVEMLDDHIVVTMPGTALIAAYRKREDAPELAAHFVQDDRYAPITRADFLARSWRVAIDKAREVGWIV
jgi:hypothetical protein